MRQKHQGQSELRRVCRDVTPDSPEVAGPGDAARMDQETRGDVKIDRECDRDDNKQTPEKRGAW